MEGFCSEISRNEINIGNKIGKGMRGVVYAGRCRGYDVAIKVIKEKLLDPMNIKTEINIMSQLRFPNVCLFLGACIEPDFFYIVQEFLPGGDLRSLSKEEKLPTSFYARMRLANQAARGMIWIHSAGILHRDLKLENLLLDKHGEVKVCDFGLSDTIGTQQSIENNKMKGSPLYMAPEVLLGKVMKKKVDVYSFGLLLWELLAKQRAFQEHLQHNDIQKFADAICVKKERPPIPPQTTEVAWSKKELVTLLQRCWHDDPDQRPDFEEIYDKLNYFIAGSIEDSWGQSFWLINFPDQYKVTWNEFIEALSSSKTVQMPDGSQLHKGLAIKLLPKHIWEALKILLGQISGSKNLTDVTVESFGKLLEWFGPGVSVKDSQQYSFLENMAELCSYSWFHGSIPSTRAQELLRSYNEKAFLVRLSSVPGSFVVQTRTTCVRITHKPGEGFLPEGGVTHGTLPQLVESTMTSSKYTPCPGSALAELLPNNQSQNQTVITPYKDMGAIVVLNGNPNQVPDKARAVVAYQLQKEERQTLERERSKKERTVED